MSAMNELAMVIDELRTAANALISAADSLQCLYSRDDTPNERKPLTLEEVRDLLRRKCEEGFATDVKQLIESLGAKSLKDVNPDDYEPLITAVQALGTEGDGNA